MSTDPVIEDAAWLCGLIMVVVAVASCFIGFLIGCFTTGKGEHDGR